MQLNFTSWWWEHNRQHKLELNYFKDTGQLLVKIQDVEPVMVNESFGLTNNRKLEPWDFFIGNEIDVLGKPTILKSCDANTAIWNESNGTKLLMVRTRLIDEIRKYESKPFPQKLLVSYAAKAPGGYNLRGLVTQISEFRGILMKYRPTLACQIVESEYPELNF